MKNTSILLVIFLAVSLCMISCGQNGKKEKELALKEQELANREKAIALKEKDFYKEDTTKNVGESTSAFSKNYQFNRHSDIQVFWNDFKTAVINKDMENTRKMCINPIPSYYYDTKGTMEINRFFEVEFVNQIKKISMLKRIKITPDYSFISEFNLKVNVPVYQLEIEGWEYSGAYIYFTQIDGNYKLVGVLSYEAEG